MAYILSLSGGVIVIEVEGGGAAGGPPQFPCGGTGPTYGPGIGFCASDQAARSASCRTPNAIRYNGQLWSKARMFHWSSRAVTPNITSITGHLMRWIKMYRFIAGLPLTAAVVEMAESPATGE